MDTHVRVENLQKSKFRGGRRNNEIDLNPYSANVENMVSS